MAAPIIDFPAFRAEVYARAADSRDARFDGLFFIGITTTRIYCRPVCPARVSYKSHRRFYESAAEAERDGYRPCLRCRPELAPGRALIDSVPRLAHAAAARIAAGALNGGSVAQLARELGVSERHLRRALEREIGVSPVELAQTYRLLLAKRLLADTDLSVTRVAFASGFQSLRRFNAAFQQHYRMPPSALRTSRTRRVASVAPGTDALLRLTLAYREPYAWDSMLELLRRDAVRGAEIVEGRRYGRTIEVDGCRGVFFVEDAARASRGRGSPLRNGATAVQVHRTEQTITQHVNVDISAALVPALMPLLARLRHLFDLDAEPVVIDTHLAQGGLAEFVMQRPGLRIPGGIGGFDTALRTILGRRLADVTADVGERIETESAELGVLVPNAARIAEAGHDRLVALGVPEARASAILAIARGVDDGSLRLEPGADVIVVRDALTAIPGIGDRATTTILMRALHWPDAFPAADRALLRAAGVQTAAKLRVRAERWRPWRAYAAMHLQIAGFTELAIAR